MRINVMGDKGGVGKSVTAMHLGAVLGFRFGEGTTVVVDSDPNQSLVGWRERRPAVEKPWPFEVVGFEDADGWGRYENVVFDSQGRPSKGDLRAAVEDSDLIVVPTTAEGLALDTLDGFLGAIRELGGADRYRVLITMVGWWNTQAAELRSLLEAQGMALFETEIRRRQAFDTATMTGRLVYELPQRRAREGWDAYERVGGEAVEAIMGARRALRQG